MSRLLVISRGLPGSSAERIAAARAIAPELELAVEPSDEEMEPRIAEVEVAFAGLPGPLVARARALRWVQLSGAGVEGALDRYVDPRVILTNASGVHAVPITEHVLAMLLGFARGIPASVRAQARREWLRHDEHDVFELRGLRLLVIGLGAIGGELARCAAALGMEVVGVRRSPGAGPVAGAMRIVGPDALHEELPRADVVVLTVPHTSRTRGMIGERELGLVKRGAYFVNIGRGKTVDENALVGALRDGRLAGAGLDVFAEEPLPAGSPLWDLPNVIVTAHYSGQTPRYGERLWAIFLDNLGRYLRGEPLANIVDREAGY